MTATIESAKLLIPLAVTLVAPFAIWFNRRDVNKREAMSFIAAAVAFPMPGRVARIVVSAGRLPP